ncbi:MAG: hypothetical protein Q9219_007703, partial [cf. Caloplaca sp. 3 TL-2023]
YQSDSSGMYRIIYVVLYPVLLFITVPLTIFAFLTTVAASSTLLFRVLLVYADLAAVLFKNQFLPPLPPRSPSSPTPPIKPHTPNSARHVVRTRSSSSGDSHLLSGSRTPRSAIESSSGLGIYSAGSMQRDFEGVGGWRIPNLESEDIAWTSMNARLELPPPFAEQQQRRRRHHRRSVTSNGAPSSAPTTGLSEQQQHYRKAPLGTRSSGTMSPEEYFVSRYSSKSSTMLASANMSKVV